MTINQSVCTKLDNQFRVMTRFGKLSLNTMLSVYKPFILPDFHFRSIVCIHAAMAELKAPTKAVTYLQNLTQTICYIIVKYHDVFFT